MCALFILCFILLTTNSVSQCNLLHIEKDPEAMARFYRHWQRDTGAMMRDYQWTWYRMNVHMLAVEWRAVVTRWRATVANIFRRRR